jgi:hypothetical protein
MIQPIVWINVRLPRQKPDQASDGTSFIPRGAKEMLKQVSIILSIVAAFGLVLAARRRRA